MNKLIKIGLVVFWVILTQVSFAQRIGYKEITEKRIEFIASRLDLSADEAQKFWPLFREFYDEREKLTRDIKLKTKNQEEKNLVTQEEYSHAIDFMIEMKINQAILMRDYNKKYLQVLPAEKIFKLYQLEEEFNKFLLKQLKESGQGRRD